MTNRHLHWDVTAYESIDNDRLANAVQIGVVGYMCEADALAAAAELIQRPFYRVGRVYECNTCAFQGKALAMQREALEHLEKLSE